MTTAQVNITSDYTSDANFRIMGAAINAQLAAMGLVQTSDTGQANWTTITRNTTGGALAGYEIWRFADTLQGTVPVFIRVEYHCAVGQSLKMGIYIQVGFGTDGAGNISGTQKSTALNCQGSSSGATAFGATACYFSGATSRIAVCLWPTVATPEVAQFFSIERSKDSAGVDNGDGVIIWYAQGGTSGSSTQTIRGALFLPFTGGVPAQQNHWPCILSNGPSVFSTKVQMGVPFPIAGEIKNPGLGVMVYNLNDFSTFTDYALTIYGGSHTYKTLGDSLRYVAGSGNSTSTTTQTSGEDSRIAMRWE